jgi:DNA polymerase
MDPLAALRLQLEWGADECLADAPINRLRGLPQPASATIIADASLAEAITAPGPGGGAPARAAAIAAAAPTVDALRLALAAFDGCALREAAANLVFADGNPGAAVMVIGEAPGADEDRTGRPFAGPAGAYLDRMLASIGLDRSHVLLTTLLPWRAPGGREPTPSEVAACLPFLRRHIELRHPRIVVTLGARAATALLGRNTSARRISRPSVARLAGLDPAILVLAMPGLESARQNGTARRQAWAALRLLRRTIDGPTKEASAES